MSPVLMFGFGGHLFGPGPRASSAMASRLLDMGRVLDSPNVRLQNPRDINE